MSVRKISDFTDALKWLRSETASADFCLFLGNGFCIAYSKEFDQSAMLNSQIEKINKLNGSLIELFKHSNSFEGALADLEAAKRCVNLIGANEELISYSEKKLREVFFDALISAHPQNYHSSLAQKNCKAFLNRFPAGIYTTNYDLLSYFNIDLQKNVHKDGFRQVDNDYKWDVTKEMNIHFLHGALHIFREINDNDIVFKLVRSHQANFLQRICEKEKNPKTKIDLVIEGSSVHKLKHIESVLYLRTCYQKLTNESKPMMIFGWSCGLEDAHIIEAIQGSKIKKIVASIHLPETDLGKKMKQRLHMLKYAPNQDNPREICWIDANEVPVWQT